MMFANHLANRLPKVRVIDRQVMEPAALVSISGPENNDLQGWQAVLERLFPLLLCEVTSDFR